MYYNNKRFALSIFWLVLGVVLLVLSVTEVLDSSVYAGFGGGLIAVGALQIIRNVKYRKDPEYKEKVDVSAKDERNSFLRMKAWAWTGYLVVIIECCGIIAAMILGKHEFRQILSYSVCLILVIYFVSYYALSRKY